MVNGGGRITFGGLASGIDTNSIIDQLLNLERRPISLAQTRLAQVRQKSDAFGRVSAALSALATRTTALNKADTYRQRSSSVLAKDADANKVTAVAATSAAVGSFTFHVTQLATQTTANGTQAVGQAVDAGVPLDEAGFGSSFTPGTFSINGHTFTIAAATATAVTSFEAVGGAVNTAATLENAGLDIAPVVGTFRINGVNVNYDPTTDKMSNVVGYINNSAAGVTASFDGTTNTFQLQSKVTGSGETITLEDVDGNFLEAMKLLDGGGDVVGVESPGTDLISLDDVVDEINNAGIGVTAAIVNDGEDRPNLLQLSAATNVQLGAGGDTSNFLSITHLLQSPPGTTRTSQRGLGAVSRTENLGDARLATTLTQETGTFTINGVEIAYDAAVDSLSNIVTRINSAQAGVTITYDAFTDTMRVANDGTGALAITMADVDGNLLAALGLTGATQQMGQSAAYSIDGGPTRYSTSNTITDAVDGVTLTATDVTTEAVRISVNLHPSGATQAMEAFVLEFNKSLELMEGLRAYRESGPSGVLLGDGTLRRIEQGLRSQVSQPVAGAPGGLRTLSDIGVSFGAVGAAVGTTNKLTFNAQKFTDVMRRDPEAVGQLMSAFTANAALAAGGTGPLTAVSGTPTSVTKTGRYTIDADIDGNLVATFRPNDGTASVVTNGAISAGGTNTTLIPGLTLTAGALVAGTNEVIVGAATQGLAKTLDEYVTSLTRAGGLLANRDEEMSAQVRDINGQIDRLEARIAQREAQLIRKFTAMETAISRMQSQQQSLAMMQSQLASLNTARRK